MIDTIGVEFPGIHIDQSLYSSWDDSRRKRKGHGFVIWFGFTLTLANGATVQYTYYPFVLNGLLKVEFSLPHIIFGNNVQMVFNIERAIDIANQLLPVIPDIPTLDLWEGRLYRLDVCYNHQVDNLVPYIIRALLFLDYSRKYPLPYGSGVTFLNSQTSTKFYDKEKERLKEKDKVGAAAARGILRQETTLRKAAIKKLTGKKNPTLRDITIEMLLDALENDLQELHLLGRSIGTVDTTLGKLTQQYGEILGLFYYGWLHAKIEHPSKEALAAASKAHPKTIQRRLAKIVEAGLPLTLTTSEEPIPPLFIDREMVMRMAGQCICPELQGDTLEPNPNQIAPDEQDEAQDVDGDAVENERED